MGSRWPIPEPYGLERAHPALADSCRAAAAAATAAWSTHDRDRLSEQVRTGADGTPTMFIDDLVERAVVDSARQHRVNLLSEEIGFLDHGSPMTLVVDPLDGSANAAAGVPLSCYSAALIIDDRPAEALSCWLETGRTLWAAADQPADFRTSGATDLTGRALSLLRPKTGPRGDNTEHWLALSRRAGRVRILSSSCLEAMLVADGATDAFADAGSDTHRIVDLAAAMVLIPAAGGFVCDAFGRPLDFDHDLTKRYSGVVAASRPLAEEICAVITADSTHRGRSVDSG